MRFCHESPSVWGLSFSGECLLCKGGLWLGGGSVGTYIATASRIWGAFTAAPMKLQTPSLPPLFGWSMLSAYVVRTSTPPSPEDRDFHPAGSL